MEIIAITDHCFLSDYFINTVIYPKQDRHPTYVVFDEQPDSWDFQAAIDSYENSGVHRYLETLRRIQADTKELTMLVAGEVNFVANRLVMDELYEWINSFDLVLFEDVSDTFFEDFLEARPGINVPVGLAHTDFSVAFSGFDPESLVEKLVEEDIFVELNTANALRTTFFYGYREFFEIGCKNGLKVSIGSDAHSRETDFDRLTDGEIFIKDMDLVDNLSWIRDLAASVRDGDNQS
jgi:histidinol phosphatase-like PHP family hydrolase